jgi:hypothetical protein
LFPPEEYGYIRISQIRDLRFTDGRVEGVG